MLKPIVIYLGPDGPDVSWLTANLQSPFTGSPEVVFLELAEEHAVAIGQLKSKLKDIKAGFSLVIAIVVPRKFKSLVSDIVYTTKQAGCSFVLVEKDFDMPLNPFRLASPNQDGYEFVDITIK